MQIVVVIQDTFFIGLLKSSVLGTASRTATFDFGVVLLNMLGDLGVSDDEKVQPR